VIEGHIDGDGIADFEIFVQGVTTLDASDFDFTNVVTYDEYVAVTNAADGGFQPSIDQTLCVVD